VTNLARTIDMLEVWGRRVIVGVGFEEVVVDVDGDAERGWDVLRLHARIRPR
jgi:hypothetical protein